jgi:hypothetical protein
LQSHHLEKGHGVCCIFCQSIKHQSVKPKLFFVAFEMQAESPNYIVNLHHKEDVAAKMFRTLDKSGPKGPSHRKQVVTLFDFATQCCETAHSMEAAEECSVHLIRPLYHRQQVTSQSMPLDCWWLDITTSECCHLSPVS